MWWVALQYPDSCPRPASTILSDPASKQYKFKRFEKLEKMDKLKKMWSNEQLKHLYRYTNMHAL